MDQESNTFLAQIALLHQAELTGEDSISVSSILASLQLDDAPPAWRTPFAADAVCNSLTLAKCPAAFWRRLARRFPKEAERIGTACAALSDEDLLDLDLGAPPQRSDIVLGPGMVITLQEGSYHSGGIGRHLYAAATAMATVLAQRESLVSDELAPNVAGLRVLELGCGLGLVGLAAALCGASEVVLTDSAESSVHSAMTNAALNGLQARVRSSRLDWECFATADGGQAACMAAGIGGPSCHDAGGCPDAGSGWWPDIILAADVCYSETMGTSLLEALSHILAQSPSHARAFVLNGWPNRGLARFEALIGARQLLAAQACAAAKAGESPPPSRPFVEEHWSASEASSSGSPRGLEGLQLVACKRLTGFADHAHHLYAFSASAQSNRMPGTTKPSAIW